MSHQTQVNKYYSSLNLSMLEFTICMFSFSGVVGVGVGETSHFSARLTDF